MAVNLGRGGYQATGSDSSQLLSTGAMFRQNAEAQAKEQAGLILQEMKVEANNRGWSMRRMAEAYPDQFKAASGVLLGGGQKGLAGADRMWAETVGGPETEEQYMEYAKDRDFAAANPEGTKFITFGQEIDKQLAEATGNAPDADGAVAGDTYTTQDGVEIPSEVVEKDLADRAARGSTVDVASFTKESRQVFLDELKVQADAGNDWAKGALERLSAVEDGQWSEPYNKEFGKITSELYKNRGEDGTFEGWITDEQGEITGGSGTTDTVQDYSDYINKWAEANDANAGDIGFEQRGSERWVNRQIIAQSWRNLNDGEKQALLDRINSDESNPQTRGGDWPIPTGQRNGRSIAGPTPFQAKGYTKNEAPVEEPQQQTTQTQPTIGGMVGYQAERDRAVEAGASPANAKYQEILQGRAMETAIEKEKALTDLYGAQQASALGNLELAYANAGQAISGLEGQFDKAHIDSAKIAYQDYQERLAAEDVPTPPPAVIGDAEAFTNWFDKLRNKQQRAYVESSEMLAKLIPGNPALAATFDIAPVQYKSGLFDFGGSPATVIVPRAYQPPAPTSTEQFMALLSSVTQ